MKPEQAQVWAAKTENDSAWRSYLSTAMHVSSTAMHVLYAIKHCSYSYVNVSYPTTSAGLDNN